MTVWDAAKNVPRDSKAMGLADVTFFFDPSFSSLSSSSLFSFPPFCFSLISSFESSRDALLFLFSLSSSSLLSGAFLVVVVEVAVKSSNRISFSHTSNCTTAEDMWDEASIRVLASIPYGGLKLINVMFFFVVVMVLLPLGGGRGGGRSSSFFGLGARVVQRVSPIQYLEPQGQNIRLQCERRILIRCTSKYSAGLLLSLDL